MTGFGKKEEVIKAIRLGVSDYFEKPLSMDEVCAAVERCLAHVEPHTVPRAEVNDTSVST